MAQASIFVSYRQSDARAWAVALRDELVPAFGEREVFFDADSLQAGRWSDQLGAALGGCRALLVVIGRGWLSASDADGRRRLDDPDDVHRREIEQGLQRGNVAVLPILVDGAAMPPAAALPPSLSALAERQALTWSARADHRAADRDRLWAALQSATGLKPRRSRHGGGLRSLLAAAVGGLVGTAALGTGFSMAAMPLNTAETLVVFGFFAAAAAGVSALLGRRQGRAP